MIGALAAAAVLAAALLATGVVPVAGKGTAERRPRPPTSTPTSASPPATPPPTVVAQPQTTWQAAWGLAMAWGYGAASDTTVRELARVGIGGEAVRVRISNLFGNVPLLVGAGTVGVSAGGAAEDPSTVHPLAFGGQPGVTVPVGSVLYSDPVPMTVQALQTLAVTLFLPGSDVVTLHPCCTRPVSYFAPNGGGSLLASTTGAGLSIASPWGRFVDAVDVLAPDAGGSIAVVGDSITDGYHATLQWTGVLQQRIDTLPAGQQRAVVNEGITANALTSVVHTDQATGGGPSGLSRLARDALDQSGVSEVVLFLGTNDLWFGATAAQVIAGYQQAIAAAHQAGKRIVAVTLLPRSTSAEELWTPYQQAQLAAVDAWIRQGSGFDGVLDLAAAVADVYGGACVPAAMYGPYDSGDHLHPNAAGQTAMADAVDPAVLQLPKLPEVPPLVSAVPTTGCPAVPATTAPAG